MPNKKVISFLVLLIVLIVLFLFIAANQKRSQEINLSLSSSTAPPTSSPSLIPSPLSSPLSSPVSNVNESISNENLIQKERMPNIYFKINQQNFLVSLVDNTSTRALVEKLKISDLVITMQDYAGMEKVGALGFDLPTNDERIHTVAGDLILYQGNSLVIYYHENDWSLTRLGKIENSDQLDLASILDTGDIVATLSLN